MLSTACMGMHSVVVCKETLTSRALFNMSAGGLEIRGCSVGDRGETHTGFYIVH